MDEDGVLPVWWVNVVCGFQLKKPGSNCPFLQSGPVQAIVFQAKVVLVSRPEVVGLSQRHSTVKI